MDVLNLFENDGENQMDYSNWDGQTLAIQMMIQWFRTFYVLQNYLHIVSFFFLFDNNNFPC